MKTNSAWHAKNRMPLHATMDERVKWHLAHAKHCGCRPIPDSVKAHLRPTKRKKK
jgi:hypothetical protein